MIYVTVGKGIDPFDRLVKTADELAPEIGGEVFIQSGCSLYKPLHARYEEFLTFPEAEELLKTASVIISHAGIGTIIGALRAGVPIVVVPRYKKYGEHFNDHQMEIARAVEGRPGVEVVYEDGDLTAAVRRLAGLKGTVKPQKTGAGLIDAIVDFIEGMEKGNQG